MSKKDMTINVNGQSVQVTVDADKPLLWVLRDELGLTGSKYGCGIGICGACSVELDGDITRSCLMPISAVEGSVIRTIEGLSEDGSHPVQRAWIEEQVPQCGYCQSGMIMAAVNLLETTPNPTEEDVKAVISNICRCGTYPRVKRAIAKVAAQMNTAE